MKHQSPIPNSFTSPMPIITLTSDFGTGSPYVAAMRGVILSLNPAATLGAGAGDAVTVRWE